MNKEAEVGTKTHIR